MLIQDPNQKPKPVGLTPLSQPTIQGGTNMAGVNPLAARSGQPGGPGTTDGRPPGAGPYLQTGGGNTKFSATNNLISTQINPSPSQRLTDTGTMVQGAANTYANGPTPTFKGMTPMDTSGAKTGINAANAQNQSQSVGGYQAVAGTNLSGAKGYMGAAAGGVNPSAQTQSLSGMGGTGSFGYAGDTTGVRGQAVGQLTKMLGSAPDRATLASNALSRLRADTDAEYQGDLRSVSQKAAAMGRRGSGLTTSDLGTVAQRRNEFLDRRMAESADNAAGLTLEDERAKLDAARGLSGELAGQDTAAGNLNLGYLDSANRERGNAFDRSRALTNDTFGRNMDLSNQSARFAGIERGDAMDERSERTRTEDRQNAVTRDKAGFARDTANDLYGIDRDQYGMARDERNTEMDFDQRQEGNRRNRFLDTAGYEGDLAGRERSDRNELRGERDYQVDQERDNYGRERQRMLDEEALYGDEFSRGKDLFNAGYGATDSYSRDLYGQAGRKDEQAQGAQDAAMDLFGEWGRSRAGGGAGDPSRDSALAGANGYLDSRTPPDLQQTPGAFTPRGPARRLPTPSF